MTMDGFTKDSVVLFGKMNSLKADQLSSTAAEILQLNNDQLRRSIISRYELLKREVDQYNKPQPTCVIFHLSGRRCFQ